MLFAISGRRGTAKTIMAQGLHEILPPVNVVVGSISKADPAYPNVRILQPENELNHFF